MDDINIHIDQNLNSNYPEPSVPVDMAWDSMKLMLDNADTNPPVPTNGKRGNYKRNLFSVLLIILIGFAIFRYFSGEKSDTDSAIVSNLNVDKTTHVLNKTAENIQQKTKIEKDEKLIDTAKIFNNKSNQNKNINTTIIDTAFNNNNTELSSNQGVLRANKKKQLTILSKENIKHLSHDKKRINPTDKIPFLSKQHITKVKDYQSKSLNTYSRKKNNAINADKFKRDRLQLISALDNNEITTANKEGNIKKVTAFKKLKGNKNVKKINDISDEDQSNVTANNVSSTIKKQKNNDILKRIHSAHSTEINFSLSTANEIKNNSLLNNRSPNLLKNGKIKKPSTPLLTKQSSLSKDSFKLLTNSGYFKNNYEPVLNKSSTTNNYLQDDDVQNSIGEKLNIDINRKSFVTGDSFNVAKLVETDRKIREQSLDFIKQDPAKTNNKSNSQNNFFRSMNAGLQWSTPIPLQNSSSYFIGSTGKSEPYLLLIPQVWVSKIINRQEIMLSVNFFQQNFTNNKLLAYSSTAQIDSSVLVKSTGAIKTFGSSATLQYNYGVTPVLKIGVGIGYNLQKKVLLEETLSRKSPMNPVNDSSSSMQRVDAANGFFNPSYFNTKIELAYTKKKFDAGLQLLLPISNLSAEPTINIKSATLQLFVRWRIKWK